MRKNNYEVKAYINESGEVIKSLMLSAESENDAIRRFREVFTYLVWAYLEVEEL